MTDKPKRTRDPNAPLSIGRAFERIDELERSQPQRISDAADAVKRADSDRVIAIVKRVDVKDRSALAAILTAAKAARARESGDTDEPQASSALLDDSGIVRDDETAAIEDSTPESLPRGALPYVEGEAAKAAARGKR
jgi:hypothetical protein